MGDPSNGQLDPTTVTDIQKELDMDNERRGYRTTLFRAFFVISSLLFLLLGWEVWKLLSVGVLIKIASCNNWHVAFFIVGILILLASTAITVFLSLLKMASISQAQAKASFLPTSPQLEILKNLLELSRQLFSPK